MPIFLMAYYIINVDITFRIVDARKTHSIILRVMQVSPKVVYGLD